MKTNHKAMYLVTRMFPLTGQIGFSIIRIKGGKIMEQIAQVDQKVEKIISRLFENPSQNNPVFSREFNGRIQGGLKFPKQIKTSNEGLKKQNYVILTEGTIFGQDDIVISVECKALNKRNDQFTREAFSQIGMEYPYIDRDKVKPLVHRHDFFELFYVYHGGCISTIENQDVSFFAGDICLYNRNAIHSMYVPHDQDLVFNVLIRKNLITETFHSIIQGSDLFSQFFIDSLQKPTTKNYLAIQQIQKTTIEFYLKKMVICFFNENNQEYLKSLLICSLYEIEKQYRQEMMEQSLDQENNITIVKILQYIEQHYMDLTLETLSEQFHYTPRNMIYYIKKYTNKTFSALIRESKIKKACELLIKTNLTPEQITEQVGYNDRSYLDKLFHQQFGVSMVKYKKKYNHLL